jgi:hypothetical protein
MQARVMEAPLQIHAQKSLDSQVIAEIPVGEIVNLGNKSKAGGTVWVSVTAGAVRGWTLGSSKIAVIKRAKLMSGTATIYSSPDEAAPQVGPLTASTAFDMLRTVSGAGHDWVNIRDVKGREGFIDGRLKVKVMSAPGRKLVGGSAIGWGLLIFIVGLVVTVGSYSNAEQSGGTYFLWWGPMLWGAWLVVRGLIDVISGQGKTTVPAPSVTSGIAPAPPSVPAPGPAAPAAPAMTICPHCGGQTRADLYNCEYCGTALADASRA